MTVTRCLRGGKNDLILDCYFLVYRLARKVIEQQKNDKFGNKQNRFLLSAIVLYKRMFLSIKILVYTLSLSLLHFKMQLSNKVIFFSHFIPLFSLNQRENECPSKTASAKDDYCYRFAMLIGGLFFDWTC